MMTFTKDEVAELLAENAKLLAEAEANPDQIVTTPAEALDLMRMFSEMASTIIEVAQERDEAQAEVEQMRERIGYYKAVLESSEAPVAVLSREVDKLKTALVISVRSNVMCKHRLATTADELAEHLNECHPCDATLVVDAGSADEVVEKMTTEGWVLDPDVEYVAGKRIRTLRKPAGSEALVDVIAAVDEHASPSTNDTNGAPA